MVFLPSAYTLLSTLVNFQALPALHSLTPGSPVYPLPKTEIDLFKPFSYYASAGNCDPSSTRNWTCGTNCEANPEFIPVASGGDGGEIQFWFVGFDPTLNTVIVSHQGTDFSKDEAVETIIKFRKERLDRALFPGVSHSVKVHRGFRDAHARVARTILAEVQNALSLHKTNHVTLTGHSLGGALALLDSVFLPLHLPNVSFETIIYAMPRVGNQAFADYVDEHVRPRYVNNKRDPVPILPGRRFGYHHPSGEIHIGDDNMWYVCPGQDNVHPLCTVGTVQNVFQSRPEDHVGPFNGAYMFC